MTAPKPKKRPTFTVSHPAQTVYRILGGQPPTGASERAAEALEQARTKREDRTRPTAKQ